MNPLKFLVIVAVTTILAQDANAKSNYDSIPIDTNKITLPSPLPSPPFPSSDWPIDPVIGVSADASDYALQKLTGLAKKNSRIKIYGWLDPSCNYSTSKSLNLPAGYNIIPNSFQLDQAVFRIERQPNTVQAEHIDWGFRITNLYGIDYRFTVADGWFSNQFFTKNNLYGYDMPEAYLLLYLPKVAHGIMIKAGRYLAPSDIESQMAPADYLFSHSVMFVYDPFTFTGIQGTIKLSRQWEIQMAVQAGNDMAPWTNSASVNGQGYIRWVSKNNNNSLFIGTESLGSNGTYRNGLDDLQMISGVWSHRFSNMIHMETEAYYDWEREAARGGSASYGPVRYGAGGGPGPIIPGMASAVGAVNYFQIQTSSKSYISIRTDYLNDMSGWRLGYANTTFTSHTIGFVYFFTNWLTIRPELRYDRTWGNSNISAYDLGTKKDQFDIAWDLIVRF